MNRPLAHTPASCPYPHYYKYSSIKAFFSESSRFRKFRRKPTDPQGSSTSHSQQHAVLKFSQNSTTKTTAPAESGEADSETITLAGIEVEDDKVPATGTSYIGPCSRRHLYDGVILTHSNFERRRRKIRWLKRVQFFVPRCLAREPPRRCSSVRRVGDEQH